MHKKNVLIIIAMAAAVALTGCLGGGANGPQLTQTGSSTVLPLAVVWAEEFTNATVDVSGGGSSRGINALLKGEADLGDASRLMKPSDYEKVGCDGSLVTANGTATGPCDGVLPTKWVVAYDVLTVVVNPNNDWARELTYDQLRQIFTTTDKAVYWDDVEGLEGAPHERIEIYAPDAASGTYDYFFEEIVPGWGDEDQQGQTRLEAGDKAYHGSSDDNVILSAIEANEHAIGFFGFSYYVENEGVVAPVAISEEGETFTEPSFETVADYPMARPLHIYTDGVPPAEDARNDYLRFVLGEGQSFVKPTGFVPLDLVDKDLADAQRARLG